MSRQQMTDEEERYFNGDASAWQKMMREHREHLDELRAMMDEQGIKYGGKKDAD